MNTTASPPKAPTRGPQLDGREAREALQRWHAGFEHDRGGRAQLRRARTPEEVALVPAFHRLLKAFDPPRETDRHKLAAAAGLVARAKGLEPKDSIATLMGRPKAGGGAAPVSEGRFRRILTAEGVDELYGALARALPLIDHRLNPEDLLRSLAHWTDSTRRRWAYDYYRPQR